MHNRQNRIIVLERGRKLALAQVVWNEHFGSRLDFKSENLLAQLNLVNEHLQQHCALERLEVDQPVQNHILVLRHVQVEEHVVALHKVEVHVEVGSVSLPVLLLKQEPEKVFALRLFEEAVQLMEPL